MTLISDMQLRAPRCPSCDRVDLLDIAVAAGSQSDFSLEWMLDRTPLFVREATL
ncbi:MAG: hypothetical protein ACI92Z_000725 [Paracoccaceae bacterium]|jgi:hypothetical protein